MRSRFNKSSIWTISHVVAPKSLSFRTILFFRLKFLEEKNIDLIRAINEILTTYWVFIGRTDVEAETPIVWPPDVKSWLTWKDSDAGRDWGQEEKGMTEDEMAGWHHRLNGHEFWWTPGVGDEQGGLLCCSSWGHKESDMTEWLKWTEYNILFKTTILWGRSEWPHL